MITRFETCNIYIFLKLTVTAYTRGLKSISLCVVDGCTNYFLKNMQFSTLIGKVELPHLCEKFGLGSGVFSSEGGPEGPGG